MAPSHQTEATQLSQRSDLSKGLFSSDSIILDWKLNGSLLNISDEKLIISVINFPGNYSVYAECGSGDLTSE